MRNLFTLFASVLLTASVFAQAPQKMSYQAVIRNSAGTLVTSTQIGMEINIRQVSHSGTIVYTETLTPTTNANGLVSIEIGGGTGFNSIDWSAGPYFIETKTDITGGTTYTIIGTSQLLSVPYALHAKTAESIIGGITEIDPIFIASPANGILSGEITNWNSAFGWGNHATAGYLTSFTETDPIWKASPSFGITNTNITNWNSAFGWGNHATAGYLTSFTETDPIWKASPSFGITNTNITNWNLAFGWGNHATAGYLTSFTETDPIWKASPSFGITNTNITNWNSAFGWGNHATAGYLTSFTETDPVYTLKFDVSSAANGDLLKFNGTKFVKFTPNYLTSEVDGSVSNEIQTLSVSGSDLTISGTGGNTVTLPSADGSETKLSAGTNVTVTGSGTAANPYVINASSGGTHYLGEEYLGGIIFHLYIGSDGLQHGLVVSKTETTAKWQNTAVTCPNAYRTEDGAYNTSEMTDSPAKVWVYALTPINTWYLPSIDELSLLWHNRYYVNKTARAVSSTLLSSTANYWSSTEYAATYAFNFGFNLGFTGTNTKTNTFSVRGVRAF